MQYFIQKSSLTANLPENVSKQLLGYNACAFSTTRRITNSPHKQFDVETLPYMRNLNSCYVHCSSEVRRLLH